ncbi:MAG TPA: DEAD/DEAH box helicase family protein [Firmicutes bacterium]|nr:DEAD/DEAH box helicase family protein [Candidatus Fermentithermobacillaceae bacterium]
MAPIYLQRMVEEIPEDRPPTTWADFDLAFFSKGKTLWDYQQQALRNALKALWKYYEDFGDYQLGEREQANRRRKQRLWQWYRDNGLEEDFSLDLSRLNHTVAALLSEYYEAEGGRLSYESFINRMSFWMATGSGKTLVIVKLIELLARLIWRNEVPPCDILFLTHRDDLIEQLKRHVEEFNRARGDFHIVLRNLREYPAVKRETPSLFREQEVTVFYYRSDSLSDEQKEKIVDFRNYDNDGRWLVLLDEAHKGDREDSKRQHIYSILSRNGFLFNFSATFTDPRDIATTVFNFNLSEYIGKGYGKHLLVLQQEMRAFRDEEDYMGEEKQKVVLKALMMLAYAHKAYEAVRQKAAGVYHRPLMLVLVNSVNTQDADLELFFRELERIAREGVDEVIWQEAKEELWQELGERPTFLFEEEHVNIAREVWESLSVVELLRHVFNASTHGEIEVLIRPSNRQEMVFKLKTADCPFALIKIGDISGWLKEKLTGYEITERFEDESYFARVNEDDSDITILMGSRTFYEGWDSNRPNIICYINIGMGEDARKFILQSVGRGVRIEPVRNKRRRLLPLYNAGEVPRDLFEALKQSAQPLETLFIFGTNRQALKTVIEGLKQERTATGERQLGLFEVNPETQGHLLLIPVYRRADRPLAERRAIAKFEVDPGEFDVLKQFVEATDDRVLLALADATPKQIAVLRRSLTESESFYKVNGHRHGDPRQLLRRVLDYLSVVPEEVERLKELEDEIRHFKHITVALEDISDLQSKAKRVKSYRDPSAEQQRLIEQLQRGEITPEAFKQAYDCTTRMVKEERFEHNGKSITLKHIAQHYYLPIVLSEDERVDYIRHIIKTRSEVRFIRDLERYLDQPDNRFREFDWWFFSKLDEGLDEVYIPYYEPKTNRIARFKPDFLFWLQKSDRYFIVFVDPKGTEHTDWIRKVEGYRAVFMRNGIVCPVSHNGLTVTTHLFLRTDDLAKVPGDYQDLWFDSIDGLIDRLLKIT